MKSVTKVFDKQEIEKTLIIPSDAMLANSITSLSDGNIKTHKVFTKTQDNTEYRWEVDIVDGKIVNITMETKPFVSLNTFFNYDSTKYVDSFDIDDVISGKFSRSKGDNFVFEPPILKSEKPEPKRRIIL